MTPDLGTIARRRYAATVLLRVVVVAWAAYSFWLALELLVTNLDGFLVAGIRGWGLRLALPLGARLTLGAIVLIMEERLVHWIIPLGLRDHLCPRCGYALKDLKSPVCPECGLDLRGPGGSGA